MFRFDLLYCAKDGVHNNNGQNDCGAFNIVQNDGHRSGSNQDQYQEILELFQKDNKDRFFLSFNQFIVPVFLTPFLDLF